MAVFDMAGTVVDEKNVVYKTLQKALGNGGYPFTLETVLTEAGGKEKFQAIKDLITLSGLEGKTPPEAVFQDFLKLLEEAYQTLEVSSYPGVREMLHRLRKAGLHVVLNTGYNTQTASHLLSKMDWEKGREYDLLVAADQVENSRPAPDMIVLAQEKLGILEGNQVAKIGDSCIDIEEGRAAGVQLAIGVTTGAHSQEQLATVKPDYILDSLAQLDELLLEVG